jgi:hypothetical protein
LQRTEEGGCSFIFMDADFIRRLSRTEHDKWTEWTAGPKWSGKTFPRMQEMEKIFGEDAFKEHTISCREAFRGNYLKKGFCAVSHRWDESGKPDSTGIHLKKIREFLDQHQDIKWIWYDFWCLPQLELPVTELTIELTPTSDGSRWVLNSELEGKQQFVDFAFDGGVVVSDVDGAVASGDGGLQKGDLLLRFEGADMTTALPKPKEGEAPRAYEFVVRRTENGGKRTKREDLYFDHQLKHANLLYLGCKVLVLLDLSYQSRFWTQFELWLSVQEGTDDGLKPATEVHAKRVHLEPIHNATKELADSLLNIWRTKTPEEAHKLLEGTDVQVTNQRDKKHHLPKILSLDEDVRLDVRKSALEIRAEHEPSASNAEETKAAAAKTAGQQDSRSGPVIGGPGRRFAVLAAVFRWAMPRSRKVAVMEQHRSPKEQERHSSEFITRLLLRLWALRAKSRVGPTGSESQSVREVAEEALSVKKEAAAAKTAGQQDNRSGPVIGGPGRLAAVFRWAMPRLAMRHRADAEQYKQALEDASRHRADSEAGKVALTWVRQTNAHMGLSTAFRVGKWASRAKSRAATAPAPVASASRPEPSASKYTVAPGEKEDHDAQKAQAEGDVEVTDLM